MTDTIRVADDRKSVRFDTTWEIRHTDPVFPGMVVIRILAPNPTELTQLSLFKRDVFLEFADQVSQVATAIRLGLV